MMLYVLLFGVKFAWLTREDIVMQKTLFGLHLKVYRAPRVIVTKAYPYRGYCATILQKLQTFRVKLWGSYRIPEVPRTDREGVHNFQKFRVRV